MNILLIPVKSVSSPQLPFGKLICRPNNHRMMRGFRKLASMEWCNGVPRPFNFARGYKVALASFPGSGNTWVRNLLQQMTGILTGCSQVDYELVKNGFPAGGICLQYLDRFIAVKTHFPHGKYSEVLHFMPNIYCNNGFSMASLTELKFTFDKYAIQYLPKTYLMVSVTVA